MGFDELGNSLARTNQKLRDGLKRNFKNKKLRDPGFYAKKTPFNPELDRRLKQAEQQRKQKVLGQLGGLTLFITSMLFIILYLIMA